MERSQWLLWGRALQRERNLRRLVRKIATCFNGSGNAEDVAVDSHDRVLATGKGNGDFALARYRTDGSLDPNFGGDGKVTTSFAGATNEGAQVTGIAVDSRGRILAAGQIEEQTFTLARYTATGALDESFGTDGTLQTQFGALAAASSIANYPDDRIVAAGIAGGNFALARYRGYP
jgi:uncharacterized delta-60 repeat protein